MIAFYKMNSYFIIEIFVQFCFGLYGYKNIPLFYYVTYVSTTKTSEPVYPNEIC